ncbi:methanogenesis marker 3 protein [Methanofervidicoccus sp. A16]|uniref:methyl-coenzyme M reductase-associated protein Mmp3 n=1 Tax=Methanofervidicoccus sp. A16 TaxID=2607662 RepID=UPI001188EB6F|nr:methanogenesis marker 3 protein [Methanofervidicoccus sp. A16]AXI25482.1 methanogenesis marker 3 protein [Methanofervidicoccus sp. A16]
MVKVFVNGKEKEGKTLKDVIEGEFYIEGSNVVIVKGVKKEVKRSKKYKITTTKGVLIIGITEDSKVVDFWNRNYKKFVNKSVRWRGISDVAFGPITIDLEMSNKPEKFKKWDVVLSISGFDKEEGHLVFIKKDTTEVYGIENPKIGILIGGKKILSQLTPEDRILSIEPLRESKEMVDYLTTKDLNIELEEGWKIWTYCEGELDGPPQTVEHVLALMENNYFEIGEHTNTYIADCRLQSLDIEEENIEDRFRGAITVRNSGEGVGKVYIYRDGRTSTPSHTVVGRITKGMELVDFSDEGVITVKLKPERLNVLGMTQGEASKLFSRYGIEHEREGDKDDNAIVVEQKPEYTLEVLKSKKVITKGLSPDKLLYIEIFDSKAPRTAWYFRKTSGLTTRRIGKLKVYFKVGDMVMFERNENYARGLLPENTPSERVEGGYIGVTNMVKRYKGYIGVRLNPHDKYGPTGETFEGTNIVGRVVKNIEILKNVKVGDEVYLLELTSSHPRG